MFFDDCGSIMMWIISLGVIGGGGYFVAQNLNLVPKVGLIVSLPCRPLSFLAFPLLFLVAHQIYSLTPTFQAKKAKKVEQGTKVNVEDDWDVDVHVPQTRSKSAAKKRNKKKN